MANCFNWSNLLCTFELALNRTVIVLIHKVEGPELISQFRPISLCTVPLKIITQVLVDRLRPLVGNSQSSFIPGRNTTDNVIVVQEAMNTMRIMKRVKVLSRLTERRRRRMTVSVGIS